MNSDECDCCGSCGYYWDSISGKCCNCPGSAHVGKMRKEYDVCGEYISRESWEHKFYEDIIIFWR